MTSPRSGMAGGAGVWARGERPIFTPLPPRSWAAILPPRDGVVTPNFSWWFKARGLKRRETRVDSRRPSWSRRTAWRLGGPVGCYPTTLEHTHSSDQPRPAATAECGARIRNAAPIDSPGRLVARLPPPATPTSAPPRGSQRGRCGCSPAQRNCTCSRSTRTDGDVTSPARALIIKT